jgi:hypothetical protein
VVVNPSQVLNVLVLTVSRKLISFVCYLIIANGRRFCILPLEKPGNGLRVNVASSEPLDTSGPPAFVTSRLFRNPPSAYFENEVSSVLHFPIGCLSQGNLHLKRSTARQTGPRWIIPKAPAQEAPTPELMTARTCQISYSQRKDENLKLHKILRKTTNASGLLAEVAHQSVFPTCANTG